MHSFKFQSSFQDLLSQNIAKGIAKLNIPEFDLILIWFWNIPEFDFIEDTMKMDVYPGTNSHDILLVKAYEYMIAHNALTFLASNLTALTYDQWMGRRLYTAIGQCTLCILHPCFAISPQWLSCHSDNKQVIREISLNSIRLVSKQCLEWDYESLTSRSTDSPLCIITTADLSGWECIFRTM